MNTNVKRTTRWNPAKGLRNLSLLAVVITTVLMAIVFLGCPYMNMDIEQVRSILLSLSNAMVVELVIGVIASLLIRR